MMKKLLLAMVVAMVVMVPGRVNANSIIPHFVGWALDANGADNILGGLGAADDGTYLWTYNLEISPASQARSAANICATTGAASCPGPPVEGSAMSNLYDFAGAISFDGVSDENGDTFPFDGIQEIDVSGLPGGPIGSGGDIDTDGTPDGWFSLIYLEGGVAGGSVGPFLPPSTPCEFISGGGTSDCPGDSPSVTNALVAYANGPDISAGDNPYAGGAFLPIVFTGPGTFYFNLGAIVIRTTIAGPPSTHEETYMGTDYCPGGCDVFEQTNFGRYLAPSSAIPEPASLFLLGTGLLGLGSRLRKKSKKDTPSV